MAANPSLDYYPPPSFSFRLSIDGAGADAGFQEISGLKLEWTVDEVPEGGENRFVHRLPLRAKASNVTLKRGVVLLRSPLADWFASAFVADFESAKVQPKTVVVMLMDGAGDPLVKWTLVRAVPVSWDHSALHASENNLLVETLELACDHFKRETYAPRGS